MAIDIIHEVFPGTAVAWERTPRVRRPQMTVDETTSGSKILTFTQQDMSDDLRVPGVDNLKAALEKFKREL